jgi:hypothetical protein
LTRNGIGRQAATHSLKDGGGSKYNPGQLENKNRNTPGKGDRIQRFYLAELLPEPAQAAADNSKNIVKKPYHLYCCPINTDSHFFYFHTGSRECIRPYKPVTVESGKSWISDQFPYE